MMVDTARMHALVIGGGPVAAAKLETLAGCGARVTVVATALSEGVRQLGAAYPETVTLLKRPYRLEDLEDKTAVVVAVDDPELASQIAAEARAARIPVNVVDNPPLCDFIFAALIQRGRIRIAISSGGDSPVLARLIKQRIEQALPGDIDSLADFLATHTPAVRGHLSDVQARRLFWESIIRGPAGMAAETGDRATADRLLTNALARADNRPQGELNIVTMPSGDPEGITVRAARLLGRADLVIAIRMDGASVVLERYARRDAVKQVVTDAPTSGYPSWTDALSQLADALESGQSVSCLFPADAPATPERMRAVSNLAERAQCPVQHDGDLYTRETQP